MANAWTGHFYKEAQSYKMVYDQVSQSLIQYENQWNSLDLESTHWVVKAEVIRWANAMAKESFSSGYGYFINMIEHQKEGSIFGVKKRMETFANENRYIADRSKAAIARWDKLASDYGVTLIDNEKDEVEIALMADCALIDIYRYMDIKWDRNEANSLVKNERDKFQIGDEEFSVWLIVRGIKDGSL